jgi:hypothetical protein
MIRFLKELYFAEFTSYFRVNKKWFSRGWNLGQGCAGVTIFMCLILVGISGWIDILVGKRFLISDAYQLQGWSVSFAVYWFNYYVLVIRGHGIRFEQEFNHLKKSKQTFLRVSCWVMEIFTAAFFICSVKAYWNFFHIIPKH